jgi:release factor glutamine methyltransferase
VHTSTFSDSLIPPEDIRALRRDKYSDDPQADVSDDLRRLAAGEPLAYVISWVPFLGLRIGLGSRPLIPRPETEWWTEQVIAELREKFGDRPFSLLDLCAGSGCIGLAVLSAFPAARVYFGELMPEHVALIRQNVELNGLNAARADIRESDLFEAFDSPLPYERFDTIVANPPYIPESRALDASVTSFEPHEALFAGADGFTIIRKIVEQAENHLLPGGALWIECDVTNAGKACELAAKVGFSAELRTDQYGRARLVVAYLGQ